MEEELQEEQRVQEALSQASAALSEFAGCVSSSEWPETGTEEALDLLKVKVTAFEFYLAHLLSVCQAKVKGRELAVCQPAVLAAAELRCLLDCVRPIESRLKYQIDKLVQMAVADPSEAGGEGEAARLDQFDMSDAEEEDASSGGEGDTARLRGSASDLDEEDVAAGAASAKAKAKARSKSTGKYVPPKITPMFFDEERNGEGEEQQRQRKRRQMQYDILQEMRHQLDDAPAEIADASRARGLREAEERRRYEEANFTRVAVSKKQRERERRAAQLASVETMAGLLPSALTDQPRPKARAKGKAKFSGKGNKAKAKKGFKKFKRK